MIKKPSDWEAATAYTGETTAQLPKGGYVLKIEAAKVINVGGAEQLVLLFDIAEGDFKGFYRERYENDKKSAKDPKTVKWKGQYRQFTTKKDGTTNNWFKGLITSIEKSNNFTFDFDESQLIGKLVGGIFGVEEFEGQDGKKVKTVKMLQARSVDVIRSGDYVIPEDKLLNTSAAETSASAAYTTDDVDTEDLPF